MTVARARPRLGVRSVAGFELYFRSQLTAGCLKNGGITRRADLLLAKSPALMLMSRYQLFLRPSGKNVRRSPLLVCDVGISDALKGCC